MKYTMTNLNNRQRTRHAKCAFVGCGALRAYRLPVCMDCARQIWAYINNEDTQEELAKAALKFGDEAAAEDARVRAVVHDQFAPYEPNEGKPRATRPGHIYYLFINGAIKIGYSADLEKRLKSYPPNAELLAVHPGTLQTETQMHRKFFNHLAHGREWFHDASEIREHIDEVNRMFPKGKVAQE